jgi:hypothetical protein
MDHAAIPVRDLPLELGRIDMRNRIAIAVGAALACATPATAAPERGGDYLVSIRIMSGGKLVGAPSLQTSAGQTATVGLDGAYRISVSATPDPRHAGNLLLTSIVTMSSGDGRRTQSSTVSLEPRQKTTFDIAPSDGADGKPLRVELSAEGIDG